MTAYNHNIDTSPEHYAEVVTTHTFQDRVNTIKAVAAGGHGRVLWRHRHRPPGETIDDRLEDAPEVLTGFNPPPESVPINCLMAMPGTPLEAQPPVDVFELVRLIATTRIAIPKAKVCASSAGRISGSRVKRSALCFFAGANSIFYVRQTPHRAKNPGVDEDQQLPRRSRSPTPQKPFATEATKAMACLA